MSTTSEIFGQGFLCLRSMLQYFQYCFQDLLRTFFVYTCGDLSYNCNSTKHRWSNTLHLCSFSGRNLKNSICASLETLVNFYIEFCEWTRNLPSIKLSSLPEQTTSSYSRGLYWSGFPAALVSAKSFGYPSWWILWTYVARMPINLTSLPLKDNTDSVRVLFVPSALANFFSRVLYR